MSSSWQYFAPYDVLMCRSQTTSPIAAENLLNIPRKTLCPVVLLRITEKISYRSYDAFGADCIVTKNHSFLGELKIPSVCISRGSCFHCYIIGTLATRGGNRNLVKSTRMEFLIPPIQECFYCNNAVC